MKFLAVVAILAVTVLSGCGTPHYNVLGAGTWGFPAHTVTVQLDIRVDQLRIRHSSRVQPECRSGQYHFLELDGPINDDAVVVLDRLLSQIPRCWEEEFMAPTSIYMSSTGGFLDDGYEMGRLFRRHGVATVLIGTQQCASACAIAFLGGQVRWMNHDSVLMFHSPFLVQGRDIQCLSDGDSSSLRIYYAEMLDSSVAELLFVRTMRYCSTQDGWTINAGAADLFGITTP